MKRIKITYGQLMEVAGMEDERPFGMGGDKTNTNSVVFANHPNVEDDDEYKPTTPDDITTTPQMIGDMGRVIRH